MSRRIIRGNDVEIATGAFDGRAHPSVLLVRDCQEFCAVGRFHQLKNRSPKMTANCVFASTHSRGAR
ncbi:hypothetical protein CN141_01775, partial [Sinorhizobium meliloti]